MCLLKKKNHFLLKCLKRHVHEVNNPLGLRSSQQVTSLIQAKLACLHIVYLLNINNERFNFGKSERKYSGPLNNMGSLTSGLFFTVILHDLWSVESLVAEPSMLHSIYIVVNNYLHSSYTVLGIRSNVETADLK